MLVSVIIPAYNCEMYIEEAVLSVLRQTHKDIEIIVVDDGSTDGTAAKVQALEARDPRIKYVHQPNKGVSAARNTGFTLSSGYYVAFLDSDDVWLPENLSSKIDLLQTRDYGLVHSDGALIDHKSAGMGKIIHGKQGRLLDSMLLWDGTNVPGPSSILMPRKVIEDVGGFDERLSTSADHDLFFRVAARYEIGRASNVTWRYRVHSGNMHKNISLMEHDVLLVYAKAAQAGLFQTQRFRRKCFAIMYLVLAASWAGDGKNYFKGVRFLLLALFTHPVAWRKVVKRIFKND